MNRGRYHFDEMGYEHLPEYLGYLVGYLVGRLPLMKQNTTAKSKPNKNIFVVQSRSNRNKGRNRFSSLSKACFMSIKAYNYRIYANKHTTEKLQWVLDRCRELYNAGLQRSEERRVGKECRCRW